jgi:hypothetical protein
MRYADAGGTRHGHAVRDRDVLEPAQGVRDQAQSKQLLQADQKWRRQARGHSQRALQQGSVVRQGFKLPSVKFTFASPADDVKAIANLLVKLVS